MVIRALMVVLGAAAGFLLFGAAGGLGAGAVLVNLFTPLPAATLGMRFGPSWGAVTVGVTALAVLAVSGGVPTLLYLVQFGLPAALIPWLLSRGMPWDRTVVVTLGLMMTLGVVVLIGVASGSGESAISFVDAQVDREINQTITLMQEFAGVEQSPEKAETLRQMAASMGDFMHRAYPGMLVVVCAALQLLTVGLLAFVVRPGTLPGPAFAKWRSPEMLIWVLIAAGFTSAFSVGVVQNVATNVLIILLPVYFLQGLAVVEHFLRRKGFSLLLRAGCFLLLLVINPLPLIVTGVGVFDLWADFRKPRVKQS